MKILNKSNSCCLTHPGLLRAHNEDTCLVDNDAGYFMVADGMGGAVAGELASGLFKETGDELFSPCLNRTAEEAQELLSEYFEAANAKILSLVVQEPSYSGMGCTAEVMVLHDDGCVFGHVGDSRTYCLSGGRLKQLTKDHTLVQEQLDQGLISDEAAKNHTMRNVILRVVGSGTPLEVDIQHSPVVSGDIFLLCSDGLYDMVEDVLIKDILVMELPLAVKATMLIDQANHCGGKDNISVTLVEVQ